ncbi:RASF1-like protein [Mya arenaria]|uniref:RASF1-like protein n=1 Tax=Mya arenaria TaxID=6604 RepID=A0ABY7FWW3_MYAAR|nr:RASF1-like protein [Mya arenaria]
MDRPKANQHSSPLPSSRSEGDFFDAIRNGLKNYRNVFGLFPFMGRATEEPSPSREQIEMAHFEKEDDDDDDDYEKYEHGTILRRPAKGHDFQIISGDSFINLPRSRWKDDRRKVSKERPSRLNSLVDDSDIIKFRESKGIDSSLKKELEGLCGEGEHIYEEIDDVKKEVEKLKAKELKNTEPKAKCEGDCDCLDFALESLPMMEFFQNDEHFLEFDRVFETVKNKRRYASSSSLDKYRWSPHSEGHKSDDSSSDTDTENEDGGEEFPELKVDDIFADFFDNDADFKDFEKEFENFQFKHCQYTCHHQCLPSIQLECKCMSHDQEDEGTVLSGETTLADLAASSQSAEQSEPASEKDETDSGYRSGTIPDEKLPPKPSDATLNPRIRRVKDIESPLAICLSWEFENIHNHRLVLQENETGEIDWEAFCVPELNNFLRVLDREQDEYMAQLRYKYKVMKRLILQRMKELRLETERQKRASVVGDESTSFPKYDLNK